MKKPNHPQRMWPQYNVYFKKKYGLSVARDKRDILIQKPDGDVTRIENPITAWELFESIERIGKALK